MKRCSCQTVISDPPAAHGLVDSVVVFSSIETWQTLTSRHLHSFSPIVEEGGKILWSSQNVLFPHPYSKGLAECLRWPRRILPGAGSTPPKHTVLPKLLGFSSQRMPRLYYHLLLHTQESGASERLLEPARITQLFNMYLLPREAKHSSPPLRGWQCWVIQNIQANT